MWDLRNYPGYLQPTAETNPLCQLFQPSTKKKEFQFTQKRNNLAIITILYLYDKKCNGSLRSLKTQLGLIMDVCKANGYMEEPVEEICKNIEQGFWDKCGYVYRFLYSVFG